MTSLALNNAGLSTTSFARLLRERVRELRDPQICGVQALRALGVQAQRLVEIECGILELVGDGLETLEGLVERDLRFSHCARQSPPTRRPARHASERGRVRPPRVWRLTR